MTTNRQVCPHCHDERFSTVSNFNRHVSTCHKNPDRTFIECSDCDRKFVRRDKYLLHLKHHSKAVESRSTAEVDEELLKNYDDGKIETGTLFDIKLENEICADSAKLTAKECLFRVNLTKPAFKLAHAGRLYNIMKQLFDIIADATKLRQPNILVQVVVESKNMDYPIATGVHRGSELKFEQLFERFDAVSQSRQLFEFDEEQPELTVTVFQMPLPTYGAGMLS